MRHLKTATVLLISVILIFSLAGCKDVDPNYGVSQNSSVAEDTAQPSEETKIMSSDRVMSNYFDISLFDEENYSEIYLGKKFEINAVLAGDELSVPSRIDDIKKLGWKLCEGNEYNENSLVFAYETITVSLENEKGIVITAQLYNSSRSSVKLSKCYIVKFKIDNDFYIDNTDYTPFNVNGITNTMAITDVIDTLGAPSHFYAVNESNYYLDYFITKRDRRNGITVYINPVDDSVTSIEFSFYK